MKLHFKQVSLIRFGIILSSFIGFARQGRALVMLHLPPGNGLAPRPGMAAWRQARSHLGQR